MPDPQPAAPDSGTLQPQPADNALGHEYRSKTGEYVGNTCR